jgi:glycosyltransferase involved in cell wall biosynthesis
MHSWTRERERALFLVSPAATPCGVEMFARGAVRFSKPNGLDATCFKLDGRFSEIAPLWAALVRVDALIVNLPMVAWKRTLFAPALALFLARLQGVRTIVTLHEWADLDWRRRLVLSFYVVFAKTVLFSSPYVRAQFARSLLGWAPFSTGLMPIPANIAPPSRLIRTPLCERLAAEKAQGRLILGHFGSIYPKKQSTFVLNVAAELKRMGRDVFVVFIGGFIRDGANVEAQFHARATALGLSDDVLVTGYIETDAEIYSIFDLVDVFAYSFAEGLTSRRGSILACLQAGRPTLVNRSANADEFEHHPSFQAAIGRSALRLLPTSADAKVFANAINALDLSRKPEPIALFEQGWRDATLAIKRAMSYRPGARNVGSVVGREPTP